MSKTDMTAWHPLAELPDDGKWRLFTHPDSTIPAIGRPLGPKSDVIENYWNPNCHFSSDNMMWTELP